MRLSYLFEFTFPAHLSTAVERVKMPNMAMDPGMQPKSAKVVFNNGVSGDIRMTQSDYKGPLEIKLNLKDLKDSVGPWHIHRLPVVSDCSANSTSGHYNPLAVTATYKACEESAACEAGDLSTKFGPLTGGDVQRAITDPKLTLFGFNR
jgi:Cu/Zn superoxide dismutase